MTALPIHLFVHSGMYRLATIHSVTDRQTDRQTDDIITPIADYTTCSSSSCEIN